MSQHLDDPGKAYIGELLDLCPINLNLLAKYLGISPLIIRNRIFGSDGDLERGEDWFWKSDAINLTKKGMVRVCLTTDSQVASHIKSWIEKEMRRSLLGFPSQGGSSDEVGQLCRMILKESRSDAKFLSHVRQLLSLNRKTFLDYLDA
jgi:hypothetical protein